MALTCPSCGNDQNFLVKTLQMHVVQLRDARVEANEEGRPAVIEVLCDECENGDEFRGFRRRRSQRSAADARRPLTRVNLLPLRHLRSSRTRGRSTHGPPAPLPRSPQVPGRSAR